MDVDLLRPGTVPIPADTFLWFEYLLDPGVLKRHLDKAVPDPSPTELIVTFLFESLFIGPKPIEPILTDLSVIGDPLNQPKRSQALKILALKVGAFLHWNLEVFEEKLPLAFQFLLLRDLIAFISEEHKDPTTHDTVDISKLEPHVIFTFALYHRWVLRNVSNSSLNEKLTKISAQQGTTPGGEPFQVEVTEADSDRSLRVLQNILAVKVPKIVEPSFDSFVPLLDEVMNVEHRWDLGQVVSLSQFYCQMYMDVSNHLIYCESYQSARESLKACLENYQAWKRESCGSGSSPYCTVTQSHLMGCCIAVGIRPPNFTPSLLQQFHNSVHNEYVGITKILEKDNLIKEIPMMYRDSLELDIVSEFASGKVTAHRDGIQEIQAINVIRKALEGTAWDKSKVSPSSLDKALCSVLMNANESEKAKLRYFLLEMLSVHESAFNRELCAEPSVKQLLNEDDIHEVQGNDFTDPVPQILIEFETTQNFKNTASEVSHLERLIVTSYEPQEIKGAIVKLLSLSSVSDMGKINRVWNMPMSVHNAIVTILRGTLQHYVHVLVAKSFELNRMKNYRLARTMLRVSSEEVRESNGMNSLVQILSWETLLIDIHQFHAEWPAKTMDWSGLSRECTAILHITDVVRPRHELYEQCILALLNMGQWQPVISSPSLLPRGNFNISQLYICIAAACLDINKYNKKVSGEAWDKLLPLFLTNQKRRDGFSEMTAALCSVVEMNALAVVISLLAKMHNVLNNQPSLDLFIHYSALWPMAVKNANQYSVKYVAEMLYEVIKHALKLYPHNVPWLKLYGDLSYANCHYSTALKYYLEAAIAGTDYFSRPLNKNILEDVIIKRMIKCCSQLQCHTQAAVLCQFLDDVDYATAFKSLAESSCADAMDTYYECIWDVTLLEYLINLHNKRGEHYRKQKAVRLIGLLELNSNNNDEIRREAENIRKAKFLRGMAKQYIC